MASLNDKLRIDVELPSGGTYTVKKIWEDSIKATIRPEPDSRAVRVEVSPIRFKGEDFEYFYAIEQDASQRCQIFPVKFYNKKTGIKLPMDSYIRFNQASVNVKRCEIIVKFTPDDIVGCVKAEMQKRRNVLDAFNTRRVYGNVGTVETNGGSGVILGFNEFNIETEVIDFLAPAGLGWTATRVAGTAIVAGSPNPPYWNGSFDIDYMRERVTGSPTQPPGNGWLSNGVNDWVRPVLKEEVYDENWNTDLTTGEYLREWRVLSNADIDNGRAIGDVLDFFVTCCPVASDFLNINPPLTAPLTEQVYLDAVDYYNALIVFQKSDVTRPNVSNNATRWETTLTELLTQLKNVLNLEWRVERIAGVETLRIEHSIYFEQSGNITLDLTSQRWERWVADKNNYTYKTEKAPSVERFAWMDKVSRAFAADDITYEGGCTNPDEYVDYTSNVTTDLPYATAYPTRISDDGLFWVSAQLYDGRYVIKDVTVPTVSGSIINGALSYKFLHPRLWTYGRYAESGYMNGSLTTFETIIRQKQQERITLPGFCFSDFEDWDFTGLVQTQFGSGEIALAEYELGSETLTLDLVF